MKFAVCSVAAIAVIPAIAQANDLPPLLEEAVLSVEESLPPAAARFAFTQSIQSESGVSIVARFDPYQSENAGWTLLEPAEDALSSDERDVFDQMIEAAGEEAPDRDLFIDDPRENVVGCAELPSAGGPAVTFACSPPADDEDTEEFLDALGAEITIEPDSAAIVGYRIFAVRPFKPAVIAKVDEMDMSMEFAPAWPDGPPAVARVTQTIAGSAMFRRFEENVTVTYSEVTPAP